jgi:hypothetical protein
MGPDDIEFIVGPTPESEPELLAPRAPDSGWRHGRWWRIALVGVVLVGGLSWALTRHSGSSQPVAATPTPTPSSTPYSVLPDQNLPTPGQAVEKFTCPPSKPCPDPGQDVVTIMAAVDQYVHHALVSSVQTDLTLSRLEAFGLGQRTISAQLDSVSLFIRIRPYLRPEGPPTQGIAPTPPGLGSALFRYETASFVIDVEWIGTDQTPPPVDALAELAVDPRLETLN